MLGQPDRLVVEVVAETANYEAGIRKVVNSAHEAERAMNNTGGGRTRDNYGSFLKGGNHADEYARKISKAEQANKKFGSSVSNIFTGNLLADVFQQGASAAVNYAKQAVAASAAASDAQRVLKSSTTEAGQSYVDAAVKAEDFARRVGLSNTEAARTYAALTSFANQAGQGDKKDLFIERFTDLTAARGIAANQLGDLARQLGTLQDESTDKLFGKNPSAFYDSYARSLKKTADSLDDTERRAAVFFASIDKGAEFLGAANERLDSTAGKLDAAAAGFDNLKTAFGDATTNSVEFQEGLRTLVGLLDAVTLSNTEAMIALNQGATPQQIAQQQRDQTGTQTWNFLKGAITAPLALSPLSILNDAASGNFTGLKGSFDAVLNPGQAQYDANVKRLEALKKDLQKQVEDAKKATEKRNQERSQANAANQAKSEKKETERASNYNFERAFKQISDYEKPENSALQNYEARLREFQRLQDALKNPNASNQFGDDLQKVKDKVTDVVASTQQNIEKAFSAVQKQAYGFLDDLAVKAASDNPFVAIFSEAEKISAQIEENFKDLPDHVRDTMAAMASVSIQEKQISEIFNSELKALDARQKAADLYRTTMFDATSEQKRQLDILGSQLKAITDIPKLLAKAQAVKEGKLTKDGQLGYSPDYVAGQEYKALKEQRDANLLKGAAGIEANQQIDAQLTQLFESLSVKAKREILSGSDPTNRQAKEDFEAAYRRQADYQQYNVGKAQNTAEEERIKEQNVYEQANTINRVQRDLVFGGFNPNQVEKIADQNLTDRTSGFGRDQMSELFRSDVGKAYERSSSRELNKESEATQLRDEMAKLKDAIGQLTNGSIKLDPANVSVTLNIKDNTSSAYELLPKAF